MRLLTLGRSKRSPADRDLLAQSLEAQEGWHQIADAGGHLLWAGRSGALGGDPQQPLWLWLREALAGREEPLSRLRRLEEAAELGMPAEAILQLEGRSEKDIERVKVSIHPLDGPPAARLWRLEVLTASPEPVHLETAGSEPPPPEPLPGLLEARLTPAGTGIYLAAEDGRLLALSELLARWLGVAGKPPFGKVSFLKDLLLKPEAAATGSLLFSPGVEGGSGLRFGKLLLRDAEGKTFAAAVMELHLEEGGRPCTLGFLQRLEEDREFQEGAVLERLSQEAPFGIAHLSLDGRLMNCNRAFAQLLGGEPDQVVGRALPELIEEVQHLELCGALERLGAPDAGAPTEEVFELRIGQPVRRIASLTLRRLPAVEGVGAYLFDLTEQKAFEARAAQSQKMQAIGQLAGGIAHDFNNLLTAMIGFADLLLSRYRPGDPSFGEIMQIKQNANRAADLIRQLLAFSRQQSWEPKVLRLTDILEDITHLLRRLIGQSIELQVVHGRDLWPVKSDQGQLEQVVINLAINARDAMKDGGVLQLRTSNLELFEPRRAASESVPPGDYVLLEVLDSGSGIQQEHLERVFEPFFSTKEVGEGTGLGLPMVYGIVKQTGGFISLESTPNTGTRVQIYLPRHSGAVQNLSPTEKPQPRDLTGQGRLLLVEDEEAVRTFSATALRNKGYEVLEARGGDEALELLQEMGHGDRLDLLITDVVMPRVDGPSLVREARRQLPGLKVIYISGYTEDSLRARLHQEDAEARYLPKPFSLGQLAAAVKEAIEEEG
ncbi:MAG TPA: ATP-binding protein [Kiloniellales bacterium]|nr:ATP-binding protein [Kiloniellales bacterium]